MKRKLIICLMTALLAAELSQAQQVEGDQRSYLSANGDAIQVKRINLATGVQLEYAEQGDVSGIPVIFLHGITDSWHSFESTLAHLPKSIHAFAISQRGHGNSERPLKGYHPKDFAADVAAFIKQRDLKSAFIVGHSMGGVHTQQFALDYPELARGIVIVASDAAFITNPGMPEFLEEVQKMQGSIDAKFMDDFQKATLAKPIDSSYYRLLVNEGLKVPVRVFKAALQGVMEVNFISRLKEIKAPALVCWGDKDAFCTWKGQQSMQQLIPNAKLQVYKNTGHAIHWEEPSRFVNDLLSFINSNAKK